jgi:ATP-dependent DNA helicase RecG
MNTSTQTLGIDEAALRGIVTQLSVQAADRVESESIEVKGWCSGAKEFFEKLGEYSACLANANGGFLILGIGEEGCKSDRFKKCPYREVNAEMLSRKLNDLTIPPVTCVVYDISDIVAEITGIPEAQAFALNIPKSEKFTSHMTVKGVSKIRVGKECRPHFSAAEDDRTRVIVPKAGLADLSEYSIQWAISSHHRQYPRGQVSWSGAQEFLLQAGLGIEHSGGSSTTPTLLIPLATILLFGTEDAIKKYAGHCETVLKTPMKTIVLRKNVVESFRDLCSSKSSLIPSACPCISLETLKELLINAYIHRCYRTSSAIMATASVDEFSIQSPGALAAGLNANNLINCIPVYRNFLLAEGARFIGLCDKMGHGIDLVFRAVLTEGFDFPIIENETASFTVVIPTKGNLNFKEFVRKRNQALVRLEDIVALRLLFAHETASLDEIASGMQRGREQARRILVEMASKMMVRINDSGSYSLDPVVRADIDNIFVSDQMGLDMFGDPIHIS